jgi:hypothetical protein
MRLETNQTLVPQSQAPQHVTDMVVLTPMVMAPLMKISPEPMALFGPLPTAQMCGHQIPLNGRILTATDMATILQEPHPMLALTMQAPQVLTDTVASTQTVTPTRTKIPSGEQKMVQMPSLQTSLGGLIPTMMALQTKLMTTARCTQVHHPSIVSVVQTQTAMAFLTPMPTGQLRVMAPTHSRRIQLKTPILMAMDLATMHRVTLRMIARQKLAIHGKTAPWDVRTLTKMDGLTEKTRTRMM